jgi:hypothetical protein
MYQQNNGRRRLADIVRNNNSNGVDDLRRTWNQAQPTSHEPLDPGKYHCLILRGELTTSRVQGTPGFKICFQVLDGTNKDLLICHDVWLTAEAMSRAKYELGQLGITDLEQLENPLPPGLTAEVLVSRRMGDDGLEYNKVRTFKAITPDAPADDFAPPPGETTS